MKHRRAVTTKTLCTIYSWNGESETASMRDNTAVAAVTPRALLPRRRRTARQIRADGYEDVTGGAINTCRFVIDIWPKL